MTLDDWIRLPLEERQTLLSEWGDDSNKWWDIVHEAVERLRHEFADRSEILRIGEAHAWGEPRIFISVDTRLPLGQRLTDLPSDYLTFPVEQVGHAEEIEEFKTEWSAILKRVFDWENAEIRRYIDDREPFFHLGLFGQVSPLDAMPREVLTSSLVGQREPMNATRIGNEIVDAIGHDDRCPFGHFKLLDDPDFDWAAAKKRVEAVAAKYR